MQTDMKHNDYILENDKNRYHFLLHRERVRMTIFNANINFLLVVKNGDIICGDGNYVQYNGEEVHGELIVNGNGNVIRGEGNSSIGKLTLTGNYNDIRVMTRVTVVNGYSNLSSIIGGAFKLVDNGYGNDIKIFSKMPRRRNILKSERSKVNSASRSGRTEVGHIGGTTSISENVACASSSNSLSKERRDISSQLEILHDRTQIESAKASSSHIQEDVIGDSIHQFEDPLQLISLSKDVIASRFTPAKVPSYCKLPPHKMPGPYIPQSMVPFQSASSFFKPYNLTEADDVEAEEGTDEKLVCTLCFERLKKLTYVPCGQRAACITCTYLIVDAHFKAHPDDRTMPCPFCARHLTSIVDLEMVYN